MTTDAKYDALFLVSFGGPEGTEEVLPFLDNVLAGKNVPLERKKEVAHHYEQFGGISPINEQNRQLIRALSSELKRSGIALPIYWGNRNWDPFIVDAMRRMKEDGVQRALAFFTSAYSSYSGCRQYREDIAHARDQVGPNAPEVHKLRFAFNHPGFIEANVAWVKDALNLLGDNHSAAVHVLFTAHSLPRAMAKNCSYEEQLLETCRLVSDRAGLERWQLVYQSRSGAPHQPWLGPDVCAVLRELHEKGVTAVVLAPIGFLSDHMEVVYDLDTEARELCEDLGMNMARARTVGTHPAFVAMIRELVQERLEPACERRALGTMGAWHDVCPETCCMPARP